MVIDREPFERSTGDELGELSITDQVLGFLAANDERAYEAAAVATRIGLDEGAVSTALTRLKKRGIVEHKGTYWAITSDERRLEEHDGYARATALFNEQFGTEDRDEWKEHAPDEPHPSRTERQE